MLGRDSRTTTEPAALLRRTVGVFPDEDDAIQCVVQNWAELDETGHYEWAVVEKVECGLYPTPANPRFFRFDPKSKKWKRSNSPSEMAFRFARGFDAGVLLGFAEIG